MWPKSPRIRCTELTSSGSSSPKSQSPRAPYNKSLISGQQILKKRRNYGQRLQKKPLGLSNKENHQQLQIAIPKAIPLTPSSSDTSLATTMSRGGVTKIALPKAQPVATPLPPYLTLKRQQTMAMMNFRARKSVSQMDFKEARRTGNYQLVASTKALVASKEPANVLKIKDEQLTKMLMQDAALICDASEGQMRIVVSPEQDVRIASLRIFNTIMLHAWRKRRVEVRNLNEQVEDYKRSFVKNRNQLHVYNSLFSVEKRRNETLNDQLKQSYRDIVKTKLSYEELNVLLDQTNREKQKLSQELAFKEQDNENLQQLLQTTKNELFQVTSQQREQLEQLTRVQREHQALQCDKQELIRQLEMLKVELTLKQEYVEQLRQNVTNIAEQLTQAGIQLEEYKQHTEEQCGKLLEHTTEMERTVQEKEEQLVTLQNCLAATVGQRIRQCFAQGQVYQHATYRMLHFVAHYMLPGTPPPPPPIQTLPEAVGKLRGLFGGHIAGNGN